MEKGGQICLARFAPWNVNFTLRGGSYCEHHRGLPYLLSLGPWEASGVSKVTNSMGIKYALLDSASRTCKLFPRGMTESESGKAKCVRSGAESES